MSNIGLLEALTKILNKSVNYLRGSSQWQVNIPAEKKQIFDCFLWLL